MTEQVNFPHYLQDYAKLLDHFDTQMDGLTTVEMGDRFLEFACKIVPFYGKSTQLNRAKPRKKKSHDKGVDAISKSIDEDELFFIQSRYKVKTAKEFDSVISGFEDFDKYIEDNPDLIDPQRLDNQGPKKKKASNFSKPSIPGLIIPGNENLPGRNYMLVTLRDIGEIQRIYDESSFSSKNFYEFLKANNRLHIVHGPSILSILQNAYRKSFVLPSNVKLTLKTEPLNEGNVYIGIITATELKKCYEDFGDALFLENIREFLGPTGGKVKKQDREYVNSAIVDTLQTAPSRMLARNNGITIRSKRIHRDLEDPRSVHLESASIVNGCQTTMCLVDNPNQEACVLVKIVELEDSWDIAKAANFQNEVKQIELEIAQYIRPLKVKEAASKDSLFIGKSASPQDDNSVLGLMESIFRYRVEYEEISSLFIGIFSNFPGNSVAWNYAELNTKLLKSFLQQQGEQKDQEDNQPVFRLLFNINQAAETGMQTVLEIYKEEELEEGSEERIWKQDKAKYRALVTILTICAVVQKNIYSPIIIEYLDILTFLRDVKDFTDSSQQEFIEYYLQAFDVITSEIESGNKDKGKQQQDMNKILRGMTPTKFESLYKSLRRKVAMNRRMYSDNKTDS